MSSSKYKKPENLQLEWHGLGEPSATGFFERLQQASLETLVTARRVYTDMSVRERIDEILVGRTQPRMTAVIWRVGGDLRERHRESIKDELIEGFWETITKGESFFEIRFNRSLKLLGLSARRKVLSEAKTQSYVTMLSIIHSGEDAEDLGSDSVAEEEIAGTLASDDQRELRLDLQAVLDQLPAEVARAMVLHYFEAVKIFSSDPTEKTVASVLGCSERKARGLVSEGLATMKETLGEDDSEQ